MKQGLEIKETKQNESELLKKKLKTVTLLGCYKILKMTATGMLTT